MLLLKPEEAFASRLQVSSRHHALSLVSINCVNNIECYWSRSHSLSATLVFLGSSRSSSWGSAINFLFLPLGLHLNQIKPLSATVVALIRLFSHLNIKICKLLCLKLPIKTSCFPSLQVVGQGSETQFKLFNSAV